MTTGCGGMKLDQTGTPAGGLAPAGAATPPGLGASLNRQYGVHVYRCRVSLLTFLGGAPGCLGTWDGYGKIAIRSLKSQQSRFLTSLGIANSPSGLSSLHQQQICQFPISSERVRNKSETHSHIQRSPVFSQISNLLQQTPYFPRQRL
jgi:hypothetical protein